MTEYEALSVGRAILAVVVVVMAARGRWWILCGAGVSGFVVSVCASSGVDPTVTGRMAYALYGLLAAHALDLSRTRHVLPRFRR